MIPKVFLKKKSKSVLQKYDPKEKKKKEKDDCHVRVQNCKQTKHALFVWLISHQPAVLFSRNKPAITNQPAVLFSQNKPAPAISHQPNEQAGRR
jgi:hypothetical protein